MHLGEVWYAVELPMQVQSRSPPREVRHVSRSHNAPRQLPHGPIPIALDQLILSRLVPVHSPLLQINRSPDIDSLRYLVI
jgi:hypothetical protein